DETGRLWCVRHRGQQAASAVHFGLEDAPERFGILVREQLVLDDPGRADQAVEPAVLGVDVLDHGRDRVPVAYVGRVVADLRVLGDLGQGRGDLALGENVVRLAVELGRGTP